MKKFIAGLLIGVLISSCVIVSAADIKFTAVKSLYSLVVNGKAVNTEKPMVNISGSNYAAIKDIASALGTKYTLDEKNKKIILGEAAPVPKNETKLPMSATVNKVTVVLTRAIQDEDSLRLYVTYKNLSDKAVMPLQSVTKVVSGGKQYEYNSDFNFTRYYQKDVDHAPDSLEPGVTASTVLFFKPIMNIGNINIVLSVDFNNIKFNNVKVEIK